MEAIGYRPTGYELAVLCVAAGVAVAIGSLLINFVWEAFKHCTGRFTAHRVRRCVACMEPAEPGSVLCARHSSISNLVRRRRIGRAA